MSARSARGLVASGCPSRFAVSDLSGIVWATLGQFLADSSWADRADNRCLIYHRPASLRGNHSLSGKVSSHLLSAWFCFDSFARCLAGWTLRVIGAAAGGRCACRLARTSAGVARAGVAWRWAAVGLDWRKLVVCM